MNTKKPTINRNAQYHSNLPKKNTSPFTIYGRKLKVGGFGRNLIALPSTAGQFVTNTKSHPTITKQKRTAFNKLKNKI